MTIFSKYKTIEISVIYKRLVDILSLFIPIYLFSPWITTQDSTFFQGIKSCDFILLTGIYLAIIFTFKCLKYNALRFTLSRLDIIAALYGGYTILLIALKWEDLDREILFMHVACGMLYVATRNATRQRIQETLAILPFLLVWQLWYGIAKQTNYFYPGKGIELVNGSFGNTGLWSCFVACVTVLSFGQIGMYCSRWIKGALIIEILLAQTLARSKFTCCLVRISGRDWILTV